MKGYRAKIEKFLIIGLTIVAIIIFIATIRSRISREFLSEKICEPHKELGIILLPNIKNDKLIIPGRPHPLPFFPNNPEYKKRISKRITFFCSTNSEGLRNKEFSIKKDEKTFRIICIGDSTTFGLGVSNEDTYPARLEEMLNAKTKGRCFEVINAGMPALDAEGALTLLKIKILDYQPDLIIVSVGINDNVEMPGHSNRRHTKVFLEEQEYEEALRVYKDSLTAIINLARKNHAQVLFLTPPVASFFPFPDISKFCDRMKKAAEENGVGIIDLKSIFEKAEEGEGLEFVQQGDKQRILFRGKLIKEVSYSNETNFQYISPEIYAYLDSHDVSQLLLIDGSHPNEAGYQVIAREIYKYLRFQNIAE